MPRASEPRPSVVVALEAFAATDGGRDYDVRRGDLFEGDHPLVLAHPALFGPPTFRFPVDRVEAATAAPGEKRGA